MDGAVNKNSFKLLLYGLIVCVVAFFALKNTAHDEQNVVISLVETIKKDESSSHAAFYSYPSTCKQDSINSHGYSESLWNNFLEANEHKNGPVQLFSLKGVANTVKWEDNLQIYDTEGGSKFFRSSDKNLIQISRVGFNENKTEALICLEPAWRGLLFHLRKQDESWVIIKEYQAWIS
jgi:hypothetical protein